MRLWHKDLIPVLPKQQLLGQWRECCAIARNIAVKGTPNHILVNKIMDYPLIEFSTYVHLVYMEMNRRGYKCDINKYLKYDPVGGGLNWTGDGIFKDWHNEQYLRQCYYNLQEKHDCGGISDIEFGKVTKTYLNSFYGKQAAGS